MSGSINITTGAGAGAGASVGGWVVHFRWSHLSSRLFTKTTVDAVDVVVAAVCMTVGSNVSVQQHNIATNMAAIATTTSTFCVNVAIVSTRKLLIASSLELHLDYFR